jgi:DNA-binding transcriptional ArsR family regulator
MSTTLSSEPNVFHAVSHTARRQMLDLIARAQGCSVNVLAGHFAMSRPAVSQHLRILLDAGLVTEQRQGRERHYRLAPERLSLVRDWAAPLKPPSQAPAQTHVFLPSKGKQSLTHSAPSRPVNATDVFEAISHGARREMLDLLAAGDCSVNTLAAHFAMSRPAVSQHLRVLRTAGLVTEQRHGRERLYHLLPNSLSPVHEWITYYEQFWDHHLLRLQQYLNHRSSP